MEDWIRILLIILFLGGIGLVILVFVVLNYKGAVRPTRGFIDRSGKMGVQTGGVFILDVESGGHGDFMKETPKPKDDETGLSVSDYELWNPEVKGGTFILLNVRSDQVISLNAVRYGFNGKAVKVIVPKSWEKLKELIPYTCHNAEQKNQESIMRLRAEVTRLTNHCRILQDNSAYREEDKRRDRQMKPVMTQAVRQDGGVTLVSRAQQQTGQQTSEVSNGSTR